MTNTMFQFVNVFSADFLPQFNSLCNHLIMRQFRQHTQWSLIGLASTISSQPLAPPPSPILLQTSESDSGSSTSSRHFLCFSGRFPQPLNDTLSHLLILSFSPNPPPPRSLFRCSQLLELSFNIDFHTNAFVGAEVQWPGSLMFIHLIKTYRWLSGTNFLFPSHGCGFKLPFLCRRDRR